MSGQSDNVPEGEEDIAKVVGKQNEEDDAD